MKFLGIQSEAGAQLAITYEPRPKASVRDTCLAILSEGGRWGLRELRAEVVRRRGRDCAETTISAKARDLRKTRWGGHDVRSEHVGNGVWVYWLEGAQ